MSQEHLRNLLFILHQRQFNSNRDIVPEIIDSGSICIIENSPKFLRKILIYMYVQAFLDFHGFDFCSFLFTAIYNSIVFSAPLVQLSNLDLHGFCSRSFLFCVPTAHINWVNQKMSEKTCNVLFFSDTTIFLKKFKIFLPLKS